MGEGYSMLGFVVIVILYAVIGLMAAAGTIVIARKIPGPKAEQIFYAMFLMMIATFYLAFAAYEWDALDCTIVTVAEPDSVGMLADVAVTVIVAGFGILSGAV